MKKYILFDNDGVLVETEKWYFQSNFDVLKQMGLELTQERYLEIMVKGLSSFIIAEEAGFSAKSLEEAKTQRNILYQEYIQSEDIAIKGVKEIVASLSQKYKMGIVTSSRRQDFELIHKDTGITPYMDFVLCQGEYKRSKPHADPYLEGLAQFNGQKNEAIVVEDSQRGLMSAYNAGIDCVIVHNDFTSNHDFTKAKYFIQNLKELEKLL